LKSQLESVSPTWTFAPTILHLISLLLFLRFHDTPLYVSGKFVPSIIEKVSPMLNQEDRLLICELQARIMDKEGGDQATVDEINKVQKLGLVALT
jgi:hypothetical protein